MLNWAQQFNIFCFLDNCGYALSPHRYECILAAGAGASFEGTTAHSFTALDDFITSNGGWCFGHMAYELFSEKAGTIHPDFVGFPLFYFFKPQVLLVLQDGQLTIEGPDPESVYQQLQAAPLLDAPPFEAPISVQARLTRQDYLAAIENIKHHIQKGDCYEVNFCQEFFASNVEVNPVVLFQKLMTLSPNPFSALYRWQDKYLICASPERFLAKEGPMLLSQPIKGTIKRDLSDSVQDRQLKETLYHSQKDRSENVMVVDLVRNDLSKVCKKGSVNVRELYGIYSFPQVHQMISTICGELQDGATFTDII